MIYRLDVGVLMSDVAQYWIEFRHQPSINRWMVHAGRDGKFFLVSSDVAEKLIQQARAIGCMLVTVSESESVLAL